MATGQSILDIMQDLNGELQLQSGEGDVAKGLRAVNAAQDMVETVMATHSRVAGSGSGTVSTAQSTESTAYPTGLLRLDGLWLIDAQTNRPAWKISPIRETGQHALNWGWVTNLASTNLTGKPRGYWTNGTSIYWDPLPDAIYTVRWYGFQSAVTLTASGTFLYNDVFVYPLAALASRFMKTSLDDPPDEMLTLAKDMFTPLIEAVSNFQRDGATGLVYEQHHDT